MIYAQPRICPGKWDAQTSLGFWNTNGSPNFCQITRLVIVNKKKDNLSNSGLCCSGWPQSKMKRKQK